MFLLKSMFVFGVLAVGLRNVQALSSEVNQKFQADMSPYLEECSAKFGHPKNYNKKIKDTDTYDKHDPCLFACAFKRNDTINDQGLFDIDKAQVVIKQYLSDEADQKMAIEMISKCKGENLREVTEGKKTCESAKLDLECSRILKALFVD